MWACPTRRHIDRNFINEGRYGLIAVNTQSSDFDFQGRTLARWLSTKFVKTPVKTKISHFQSSTFPVSWMGQRLSVLTHEYLRVHLFMACAQIEIDTAKQLVAAFRDRGFAYLIGHGVPQVRISILHL
jgi:hypothetical protein